MQKMLKDLNRTSTLNNAYYDYYQRENQKNMNKTTQRVWGNQAKQPKNNQDDRYSFKHFYFSSKRPSIDGVLNSGEQDDCHENQPKMLKMLM